MKKVIYNSTLLLLSPLLFFISLMIPKKKQKIIWGTIPLINIKYLSDSLKKRNYKSETLVYDFFKINEKEDFDLYYNDLTPRVFRFNKKLITLVFGPIFSFFYVLKYASVIVTNFNGFCFWPNPLWKFELLLYKFYGIKIISTAYGSDAFMYSKIHDKSLLHGLLLSYPKNFRDENLRAKKLLEINKLSDASIFCTLFDGISSWSCIPVNYLTINNDNILEFIPKTDKKNLTVVHCPNHRGFKGTEFIINIIEELKDEGYKIDFKLLENVKNSEILEILKEDADILIEQILYTGYSLNAIEGMASGLPVMSNLEDPYYTTLFRRYSYLNECPILSTTPENLKENLIVLIKNKELRDKLGKLGTEYVKKYHSEKAAQYLFGKILNQLLNGVDEDLMNMYHPLKSEYVKQNFIKTPLVNNQYLG